MLKSARILCIAAAAALAGCADHPTEHQAAVPGAPKAAKSFQHANVREYGAHPDDGQDDQAAFQAAVDAAQIVFVPAGTYDFENTVLIPSDTHIYGEAQKTVLRATGDHWKKLDPKFGDRKPAIFFAYNTENLLTSNVIVEHLAFESNDASNIAYAVDTALGNNIRFSDSWVTNLGVMNVDRASNVRILRVRGSGVAVHPHKAVDIAYSWDVTVQHDTIVGYHHGIMWWGGYADPAHPEYDPLRRKQTGRITIDGNRVVNVGGGIWGSNGEYVRVTNNTVLACADVCLDAEGSDSVSFVGNTARWAGASVLAAYFYSTRILFENNEVEQAGQAYGIFPSADTVPSTAWVRMFWLPNPGQDPSDISVELRGNRFTYTGATDRVGLLQKHSSNLLVVANNTLTNTVVDMKYNNDGQVHVTGNNVLLTYNAQRPGIFVGSNHYGDPYTANGSAYVTGNIVTSTTAQSQPGIRVWQWAWGPRVFSYIQNNEVRGFGTWLHYINDNQAHYWSITGNKYTGGIIAEGNHPAEVYESGNTQL